MPISHPLPHVHHELQVVIFSPSHHHLLEDQWALIDCVSTYGLTLPWPGLQRLHLAPLSHPLPSPHAVLGVTQKNSLGDFKPHCPILTIPCSVPILFLNPIPNLSFLAQPGFKERTVFTQQHPCPSLPAAPNPPHPGFSAQGVTENTLPRDTSKFSFT